MGMMNNCNEHPDLAATKHQLIEFVSRLQPKFEVKVSPHMRELDAIRSPLSSFTISDH